VYSFQAVFKKQVTEQTERLWKVFQYWEEVLNEYLPSRTLTALRFCGSMPKIKKWNFIIHFLTICCGLGVVCSPEIHVLEVWSTVGSLRDEA
jgi:hypothetical protein